MSYWFGSDFLTILTKKLNSKRGSNELRIKKYSGRI